MLSKSCSIDNRCEHTVKYKSLNISAEYTIQLQFKMKIAYLLKKILLD